MMIDTANENDTDKKIFTKAFITVFKGDYYKYSIYNKWLHILYYLIVIIKVLLPESLQQDDLIEMLY